MMKDYETIEKFHKQAAVLSGGNIFAYMAITVTQLVLYSIFYVILKIVSTFKLLFRF
jgi:hypothetical protein